MSRVFVAHDGELNRPIVIKVLPTDKPISPASKRFNREIQLVAQLQHPCIVPLLSTGSTPNFPYFMMPYIEGETLKDRLSRGPIPIAESLKILRDVASALVYANSRGIVHRDLKPANILISGGYALVADFGIAKALSGAESSRNGDGVTETGMVVGTPAYMAPEQAMDDPSLDHRADIYAFGVVAYEMLSGHPPFSDSTPQKVLLQHITKKPEPISKICKGVPPAFATLVMKCLEKEPSARPQTASEIVSLIDLAPGTRALSQETSASADLASIAVLPFVNMSADAGNEYFADGMTEEIITALSQRKSMRVASRMSSFAFKGSHPDLKEVAAKLSVSSVLVGTVRKSADRIRIRAELLNADDGRQLWSAGYDRYFADVFNLQDEISAAIANALESTLGSTEAGDVRRPTENLSAYDLYLRGRYFWNQRGDGLAKGLEFFQQALKLDPKYALAWVGIADSYSLLGWYEVLPPSESFLKARSAILEAIALDDTLAEAHSAYAFVSMCYDWNWELARKEFDRAIELNPGYPPAWIWIGALSIAFRHFNEGITEVKRALEYDPLSYHANLMAGWLLVVARRYVEAVQQLEKTRDINPDLYLGHQLLGLAFHGLGQTANAVASLEQALALGARQPWTVASLAFVLGKSGRVEEARALAAELVARSNRQYVSFAKLAIAYAGTGELDELLTCLEAAYQAREGWILGLLTEPAFDEVRSHPRFTRLLEQVRFV